MTRQPDLDFRQRLYNSYVSTHSGVAPDKGAEARFHHVIRRLPEDRRARILDLGCGQGTLLRLLAERGYEDLRGIDASPEQVAEAHRRGLSGVRHANLLDFLPAHGGEFDVVIAVDVIEHFEKQDVLLALEFIHAALRPGGRLVAQVPNGESPFVGRYLFGDFTHGTAFTSRSLRQVLGASGFHGVETFPVAPSVHGIRSAGRFVLWRAIAGLLKLSLAAETGVVRGHVVTQNLVFVASA